MNVYKDNMSPCAFGTWKLSPETAAQVVSDALCAGFRHIDTAAGYANEKEVADGIDMSDIPRASLYIPGKLWNTRREYDKALKACKKSLKQMGLERFDQYLIHWPATPALHENWRELNAETWRAMETLKRDGLVGEIGVCNFKPHHLEALIQTANVMPFINQIEFHPGWAQNETRDFCDEHGIHLEAWSPLGNGQLLANSRMLQIAKKHACSSAQVCLRWCLQHGTVPITKTVLPERMRSNLDIMNISLSNEEMLQIDAMPITAYSGLDPDTMTQFN